MPGVCRCDLTNACAFYHYHCTRGYRAHRAPGIPCALCLERAGNKIIPRAKNMRRDREVMHSALPSLHAPLRVAGAEASKARSRGRGWGVYRLAPLAASLLRHPPSPTPPHRFAGGRGGAVRDGRRLKIESVKIHGRARRGTTLTPQRSGFFSSEKRSGSSPIDGCSIGASTMTDRAAGRSLMAGSLGTSRCEVAPRQRSSTAPTKCMSWPAAADGTVEIVDSLRGN